MRNPTFWITSTLCVAADLASKYWIFSWIGHYGATGKYHSVIPGFFAIRGTTNRGGIWGIGQDMHYVFAVVRVLALFIILFLLKSTRPASWLFSVGLGMVFGGALGNVWDTLVEGSVRDFLEFNLRFMMFPTFNIADSCITVGAALLLLHYLRMGRSASRGDGAPVEV